MERYRVYPLEGLDCVGKTTSGKLLAGQTDSAYLYCMDGNPLRPYRKYFDNAPLPVRFLYYLAASLITYKQAETLRKSADVYVDRYIASTIAYHRAYGLPEAWFSLIPQILINQIDRMIYFALNEETRVRRVMERSMTEKGLLADADKKSITYGPKVDNEYRRLFTDRTIIAPVDNKSPQEVVDHIKSHLCAGN